MKIRWKKIKTPLPKGRPLGKKWKRATLFSMRQCPYALGGDNRNITLGRPSFLSQLKLSGEYGIQ